MKTTDKNTALAVIMLISSMLIFGTIGLLRKFILLSSALVALTRAVVGCVFLLSIMLIRRKKPDFLSLRRNVVPLVLSSLALGFNWVLLFEAYSYLSIASATLIYYFAPTLVILLSVPLFGDKLSVKHIICAGVSLVGMVLISGIIESTIQFSFVGILLALGAMLLYATVVLLNRKCSDVPAFDRTFVQLLVSSLVLLPYVLFTDKTLFYGASGLSIGLVIVAGIMHTGIAYLLYFASVGSLKSHTVAIFSYIDPTLAVILSFTVLGENFSIFSVIGAVLIIGASIVSETSKQNKNSQPPLNN
jgi:RarD protein